MCRTGYQDVGWGVCQGQGKLSEAWYEGVTGGEHNAFRSTMLATTSRSSITWPTRSASCTWARSSRSGDAESVFRHPAHPYTQGLLNAVPVLTRLKRGRATQAGHRRTTFGREPAVRRRFRTRCEVRPRHLCERRADVHRLRANQRAACTSRCRRRCNRARFVDTSG